MVGLEPGLRVRVPLCHFFNVFLKRSFVTSLNSKKVEKPRLMLFHLPSGRILSRLLTHTHLPGLSSLDQMHLLALADTVSTCDADFAERFANNAKVDVTQGAGQEVMPGKYFYKFSL